MNKQLTATEIFDLLSEEGGRATNQALMGIAHERGDMVIASIIKEMDPYQIATILQDEDESMPAYLSEPEQLVDSLAVQLFDHREDENLDFSFQEELREKFFYSLLTNPDDYVRIKRVGYVMDNEGPLLLVRFLLATCDIHDQIRSCIKRLVDTVSFEEENDEYFDRKTGWIIEPMQYSWQEFLSLVRTIIGEDDIFYDFLEDNFLSVKLSRRYGSERVVKSYISVRRYYEKRLGLIESKEIVSLFD